MGKNASFVEFRYVIYSSRCFRGEWARDFSEYRRWTDRDGRPVVGAYRTVSVGRARQIGPNRAEQQRVMTCVMNMSGRIRSAWCGVGRVMTERGVVHSIWNPILADEKNLNGSVVQSNVSLQPFLICIKYISNYIQFFNLYSKCSLQSPTQTGRVWGWGIFF